MKNKKVLITGSSGFIGFHVVENLLKNNYHIVGIDNHNNYYDPKLKNVRKKILNKYKNFKFFKVDIKDKDKPSWISTYEHMTSCDPVVVQDNYAFVTLRGGNECMGFNNQLDIIDISKIDQPTLFKTYEMIQPHGLGVDNNCLFITEGEFGLKMFDISNLNNLKLIEHFKDISSIDVIPFMNVLMVIGEDGFHQYSYDCEEAKIEYISTIPIVKL